jgi:hypothetical protein
MLESRELEGAPPESGSSVLQNLIERSGTDQTTRSTMVSNSPKLTQILWRNLPLASKSMNDFEAEIVQHSRLSKRT